MENFAEFDVGDNDFLIQELQQELRTEGYDCASVDVLLRMARDGEYDSVGDILGALVAAGNAHWAGEILRMTFWPAKSDHGEPNYAAAAAVLTYLVDMGHLGWARSVCPHLLVQQQQGPDCYDLAFTLGHMIKSRKSKQAAQLLTSIYSDDSTEGQNFRSLVPCMLGTLVDFQQADWAGEAVAQLCVVQSPTSTSPQPDYAAAGWCLAQQVFFGRADWAAAVCQRLRQQPPPWYREQNLLASVGNWGGEGYVQSIYACLQQ